MKTLTISITEDAYQNLLLLMQHPQFDPADATVEEVAGATLEVALESVISIEAARLVKLDRTWSKEAGQ